MNKIIVVVGMCGVGKTVACDYLESIGWNKIYFGGVVLEKMNLTARIGSVIKDKEYSLLDVGIAVEHFCLQAAELGLGTCILGWFDEKKVKKLLGVDRRRIPLLITLGYPAGATRPKSRKTLEEMSSWNKYE